MVNLACLCIAFFSPSYSELLLLVLVALLLYGGDLPKVARSWGKTLAEFRKGLSGFQNEFRDVMYERPRQIPYTDPHYNKQDAEPGYGDQGYSDRDDSDHGYTAQGYNDQGYDDQQFADSQGADSPGAQVVEGEATVSEVSPADASPDGSPPPSEIDTREDRPPT